MCTYLRRVDHGTLELYLLVSQSSSTCSAKALGARQMLGGTGGAGADVFIMASSCEPGGGLPGCVDTTPLKRRSLAWISCLPKMKCGMEQVKEDTAKSTMPAAKTEEREIRIAKREGREARHRRPREGRRRAIRRARHSPALAHASADSASSGVCRDTPRHATPRLATAARCGARSGRGRGGR